MKHIKIIYLLKNKNKMGKFRKKPVVIEAWEWDETKTTFEKIGCKR